MKKADQYQAVLRGLIEWDDYLLKESGLPGPRGNIELAQVVADEGSRQLFERYLVNTAGVAPVGSPYEFLAFCGVIGLGRLLADGDRDQLIPLRRYASDPRWRIREAVAMALQRLGEVDMDNLLAEMRGWALGSPYEQRAAAAALCEPRLLQQPHQVHHVLEILDQITGSMKRAADRHSEGYIALRKGMGYCWSVVVAALPEEGKAHLEKWFFETDRDIRWVMHENLTKARLERMDARWVVQWRDILEERSKR